VKVNGVTASICTSDVKALPILVPDGAIIDRLVEKVDDRQDETLLFFRHFQRK
jgi:hypothetical protein